VEAALGRGSPVADGATTDRPFGELTPLLAPRSVAIIGASEREGNLGGVAVRHLRKFGFSGAVWPVNPSRKPVADLPCFASLADLPSVPDLGVIAVAAEAVTDVVRDCIAAKVPAAVVWAGGFAEGGEDGKLRQRELEQVAAGRIKLCGPNCLGIINTANGLTASFSSLLVDFANLIPGAVSMVSQSGGISITAHAKAQQLGLGFRATISCGNEALLSIGDFIAALAQDDGTRVIAVYAEGFSDPQAFIAGLTEARRRNKPVVILKGGATEESGRAALAHTGRLAGLDRTYDGVFREFAAIRVYSVEELLDVSLQLAALGPGNLPAGNRVLLSSFGGGSGVIGTDQCAREGLAVPPLGEATRHQLKPIFPALGSMMNPVDLTPGAVTNPAQRAHLPDVLKTLADSPDVDIFAFLSAGFDRLAPEVMRMFEDLRSHAQKPVCLSWLSPPPGITEALAARGIPSFDEHARLVRAIGHIARYAADTRHRIHHQPEARRDFPWAEFVHKGDRVVSENIVAAILEKAGLPVAKGHLATTASEAGHAAEAIGFPVVIKAISPKITHRAAAGLVRLGLESADAVASADRAFRARATELGVTLDGTWVQHMVPGNVELLVTAFRDREFGVMVGCGIGGGMTEIVDDVVFTRAPVDAEGAADLIDRLRTIRRLPDFLSTQYKVSAAAFIAGFSALIASAPWERFTFEINPLKLGKGQCAAVDGLLLTE
jgi:acetate---CoA ligase (ADP-forming)